MNKVPLIYLDNCCFNRPFDDQRQAKVRLETEAKLFLQQMVKNKQINLVWSFILTIENSRNPFEARRNEIELWENLAEINIAALKNVKKVALYNCTAFGLKAADATHLACAMWAKADCLFTTDRHFLSACKTVQGIQVINPLEWFKERRL